MIRGSTHERGINVSGGCMIRKGAATCSNGRHGGMDARPSHRVGAAGQTRRTSQRLPTIQGSSSRWQDSRGLEVLAE